MPDEVAFRPATPADAPAVAALVDAAYRHYIPRIGGPPGPMQADYQQVLRDRTVILAEAGGRLAGLIVLHDEPDELVLENIAVDPQRQGSGLGGTLLDLAESTAQSAGHPSIRLYTHHLMTENIAFYRRRGYMEYPRPGDGEGFLTHMRKQLRPGPAAE